MKISEQDEKYLIAHVGKREAFLVLGAGAVTGCKNASGHSLKTGGQLAATIAEMAGFEYKGEPLDQVIDAAGLPEPRLVSLFQTEFQGCQHSEDLAALLSIPWFRIYTFNIDDSFDSLAPASAQIVRRYNAIGGVVAQQDGPRNLFVIHLNGYVRELERGFIFSSVDYNKALASADYGWYREASRDYFSKCPIFIGTALREPLLFREIERSRESGNYNKAFLVTPTEMSAIEIASYQKKGIIVLNGTLRDFTDLLRKHFGQQLKWSDGLLTQEAIATTLSNDEIVALQTVNGILPKELFAQWNSRDSAEKARAGRLFYLGNPPSWEIASSDVPVGLSEGERLFQFLLTALSEKAPFVVIVGDAGSGKTTTAMQQLLRLANELGDNAALVDVEPDTVSVSASVLAAAKYYPKRYIIAFIQELFLFRQIRVDLQRLTAANSTVIAIARSSEWHGQLKRHLGPLARVFEMKRFSEVDEGPLIERLTQYVPAPEFQKLSAPKKLERLKNSRQQLLIALRQTTESRNFDETISEEYTRLPNAETKALLCIVAVSTLARVGIKVETAFTAYNPLSRKVRFDVALENLSGIVLTTTHDRLLARHEYYARYLINNIIPFREFAAATVAVLQQFVGYEQPLIRMLGRQDAQLFRYLLNADFIHGVAKLHGVDADGLQIYERFEIHFQRDGHFWLQYGLYYDRLGNLALAERMFERSNSAYRENSFAQHALARIQLRIATDTNTDDVEAAQRIDAAVKTLNELDARDPDTLDTYPLVTLARHHVGALVARERESEAKDFARKYLDRLNQLARRTTSDAVEKAQQFLTSYIATGRWVTD